MERPTSSLTSQGEDVFSFSCASKAGELRLAESSRAELEVPLTKRFATKCFTRTKERNTD